VTATETRTETMTFAEAIRAALTEEMEADERVFVLGEDIGVYGGAFGVTTGMLDRFGAERIRDTPIAEEAIVGAAVGAALCGMRPVAEMQFSDFTAHAMDQLVNQAAKVWFMLGGAVSVPRRPGTPTPPGSRW
jgi:pyruvate/2-oxoglutarate/acetoin dehydrogenase E1 component